MPSENVYEGVMSWNELEEMDTDDYDEEYEKNLKEIKPNSCCCLIFTSGTTGMQAKNSHFISLLNLFLQKSQQFSSFPLLSFRKPKRRNDESRQCSF